MRLDFNVLWVEDQIERVQAQKEGFERIVNSEGFRLQTEFASSVSDALDYISDDVYRDNIDLILMDYELGAGQKGDIGIVEVQKVMPYKEIIFYSSQADNLLDILKLTNAQGVYLSTRTDIPDTAGRVFDTLIKKVLDIDHARGIVMGISSDIDYFVDECLIAVFESSSENIRSGALTIVQKHMKEKRKKFSKDADSIEAITHISELLKKRSVYTSVDRLRLLRGILSENVNHTANCKAIKEYEFQTIPERNKLAHIRAQPGKGFSRKLFNLQGEELTRDKVKTLRLALLRYQELFEDLYESVKVMTPQQSEKDN